MIIPPSHLNLIIVLRLHYDTNFFQIVALLCHIFRNLMKICLAPNQDQKGHLAGSYDHSTTQELEGGSCSEPNFHSIILLETYLYVRSYNC